VLDEVYGEQARLVTFSEEDGGRGALLPVARGQPLGEGLGGGVVVCALCPPPASPERIRRGPRGGAHMLP